MSNIKAVSTVAVVVLVINALWRTVQNVQFLLHLWPYSQAFAAQGAATSQALALNDRQIVSDVIALLTWWSVAALAWLVHSEALRRPTSTV